MKLFGRKNGRRVSRLLPLCLILLLVASFTVGGTLAYLHAQTNEVINTFNAGEINYTLNLEANAKNANAKYDDEDVSMPAKKFEKVSTALSVDCEIASEPTLTGYTFEGWYYDADCTEEYPNVSNNILTVKYGDTHDSNTDPNKVEITVYAKWSPIEYTVKYHKNADEATGTTADSLHTYDVTKNLTANGYSRTGYAFQGWSPDKNATAVEFTDAQEVVNLTATDGDVIDLYAVWKQMDFTVYFDTQVEGITANPTQKTVTFEKPYGALATASRTGYILDGWALDKEGTEPVTAETIVEIAKDHTLYAQWTPITYTVKYDKNATSATGTTADSVHTYDVEKNLTKNGFSRVGYKFLGWSTDKSATTATYSDQQSVINLANTQGAVVQMYAVWEAQDVTYKVQHWQQTLTGADTPQNSTNYTLVTADTQTLPAKADSKVTPAVKTYTGFTSPSTQTVTVAADGSTVVNYYYTRNSYTVTLQKDTGIATVTGAGTYKYGASVTINATLSNGYKWVNWTGSHSTTTQKYTFTMPASNVTDKANADPIVYKITYTLNGGSVSGNPTTYTVETPTFTLKNPTRTGYTFTGWTGTGLNSASKSVSVAKGSTGDRAYTANWSINSYKVTVVAGTGIASVSGGGTYNYNSSVTIKATLKTGYRWVNWTGSSTVTNQNYTFNMPASDRSWTANGTPITYYVKYNANGGSGSMANTTHTYDTAANLRTNAFSRTGYTFAGWTTNANGSGTSYSNGQSVKNLTSTHGATINLYAKWTPITYNVVYHSNFAPGVTEQTVTVKHTYDTAKNLNGNTTFSYGNNLLIGWKKTAYNNGSANDIPIPGIRADMYTQGSYGYKAGQSVKNLTTVNNDTIHLYAVWTPKTVEVWGAPNPSLFTHGQGLGEQNYAPNEVNNGMSSPGGYLWQEHPSSTADGLRGLNNIRKDDLHHYPVGYNSVYRYQTNGVIMDITYMNYFRFDIRMAAGTLDQLRQMGSGQIEFTSSGVCDNNEISALWSTIWPNSYYISHYNQDTGDWVSIYVPLSIFGGSTNKAAINFVGVYWNGGTDIGLRAFMCDPRFERDLPAGAKKFDLAKPSEPDPIDFTFDISIDELGAFANDEPVAGQDFTMTFTPAEGYEMPENILAVIDGSEYIYPSADLPKGTDVDGNECYVLTISGDLLPPGCSLYIEALVDIGEELLADVPGVFVRRPEEELTLPEIDNLEEKLEDQANNNLEEEVAE